MYIFLFGRRRTPKKGPFLKARTGLAVDADAPRCLGDILGETSDDALVSYILKHFDLSVLRQQRKNDVARPLVSAWYYSGMFAS